MVKRESSLDWLYKAVRRLGIDLSPVALQSINKSDSRVVANQKLLENYFNLLSAAQTLSGDSDIGLHIGETLDLSELGVYGHVLLYAATVEDFLYLIEEYSSALADFVLPRVISGEHMTRLEYHIESSPAHPMMHDIGLTLSAYVTNIRGYVSEDWQPVRVGFTFSAPADISEYQRIFGEPVEFDQPRNFIEIQNEILNLQIREIEPSLRRLVRSYVDDLINQSVNSRTTYERAKAVLVASLGQEGISQESVAMRLNMSRASLQRHLAAEGTSFRRVREEVVYHLARQTLSNTHSSISDIALMLGYSDASAFGRAFKQLSGGLTPLQFRHESELAS